MLLGGLITQRSSVQIRPPATRKHEGLAVTAASPFVVLDVFWTRSHRDAFLSTRSGTMFVVDGNASTYAAVFCAR